MLINQELLYKHKSLLTQQKRLQSSTNTCAIYKGMIFHIFEAYDIQLLKKVTLYFRNIIYIIVPSINQSVLGL